MTPWAVMRRLMGRGPATVGGPGPAAFGSRWPAVVSGRGPVGVLAEWTKLRSVRSDVAAVVAVAVLMLAGTLLVIAGMDLPACDSACLPGGGCSRGGRGPERCVAPDGTLTLVGVHFAQLAAIVFGVAGMAGEFQPRLLRVTFAMRPGRVGVFGAKAAVVAGAVAVTGTAGVLAAVVAGRALLAHRTGIAAVGPPGRAVAGTVLYLVLVALLSLGVAAATRSAPVASGVVITGLYGPYLLTLLVPLPAATLHAIQDAAPMTAGLAVQAATEEGWTGSWVLAAYTGGCLLLGTALLRGRDA